MDSKLYFFVSCLLLLRFVSVSRACSCKPNLKKVACNSDFVIIAKVLEERQMTSTEGWVFHYSLNITEELKTSAAYEDSEKIMQVKMSGDGCGGQLTTDLVYIFAGHVSEYMDEGVSRQFLETKFCNYVDFEYLAQNDEMLKEVIEMIQNPPACVQSRATVEKVRKFNDPFQAFNDFRKRRWNQPFEKRRGKWNRF